MLGEASSSSLAPGFRFHPTDEELVSYYLKRKVSGRSFKVDAISVIDIYKSEPWDLPDKSRLKSRDLEWYFFSALDKKYGNGWRTNRATDQGYWKTTGKDREIKRGSRVVGMKKTLVYHIGRAPRGERTNWVMHEYRLVDEDLAQSGVAQDAFVLCRIFQKSGTGPKNGEQYGAPFVEEEWDEDEEVKVTEGGDVRFSAGDVLEEESSQQHYNEQDLPLEAQPLNVELPVGPDGGDGLNIVEEQMGFARDGQNIFIGSGESVFARELPNEQFFESPEQFQMDDHTAVKDECFDFDELLNSVGDGNHELASGNLAHFNGSHDPPVVNGSFIEMDDFENPVKADPSGFEMLDEYLTYFDATEDILNNGALGYPSFEYLTTPEANDSNLNFSEGYQSDPLPCKVHGDEGASSSEEKPEIGKVASPDALFDGWDSTLAKQVSRMLGSIPAPAAHAAELPKEKTILGQNSTQSSSSIHVTAGMIHISSMRVDGNRKGGDVDFLIPYSFTRGNMMSVESLISSFEPTTSVSGKAGMVMARSAVYLIFLWVLILSVTYKVGSSIYLR